MHHLRHSSVTNEPKTFRSYTVFLRFSRVSEVNIFPTLFFRYATSIIRWEKYAVKRVKAKN